MADAGSTLKQQVQEEIKDALRGGEKVKLGALRFLMASVKNREIELRLLYEDPVSGAEHYLIRYPAGLKTKLHRHTASHTIVVLEGLLEVNGRVIGPCAYAHFPAGEPMVHAPAGGEPCTFIVIFNGPVDMSVVEG